MAHAKQARRIAQQWASILGAASGLVAGEEFVHETEAAIADSIALDESEDGDSDRDLESEVQSTLRSVIGTDWDSSGVAAQFDRCPKGHESEYWAAYNAAADRVATAALTA
jgi:hypothetical protein